MLPAQLREQFTAVLGQDVRNPLGSITLGAEHLLASAPPGSLELRTLERIRASARRIAVLVDDVLDLARGRLGGGIEIEATRVDDLVTPLRHVVAELSASEGAPRLEFRASLSGPVHCDLERVEQLLSNLVGNALEHGAAGVPVRVAVEGDERVVTIRVSNQGAALGPESVRRLFQPYFRAGQSGRGQGLGLGRSIVSEIAKSHQGHVEVVSSEGHTEFTFSMPRTSAAPARG